MKTPKRNTKGGNGAHGHHGSRHTFEAELRKAIRQPARDQLVPLVPSVPGRRHVALLLGCDLKSLDQRRKAFGVATDWRAFVEQSVWTSNAPCFVSNLVTIGTIPGSDNLGPMGTIGGTA